MLESKKVILIPSAQGGKLITYWPFTPLWPLNQDLTKVFSDGCCLPSNIMSMSDKLQANLVSAPGVLLIYSWWSCRDPAWSLRLIARLLWRSHLLQRLMKFSFSSWITCPVQMKRHCQCVKEGYREVLILQKGSRNSFSEEYGRKMKSCARVRLEIFWRKRNKREENWQKNAFVWECPWSRKFQTIKDFCSAQSGIQLFSSEFGLCFGGRSVIVHCLQIIHQPVHCQCSGSFPFSAFVTRRLLKYREWKFSQLERLLSLHMKSLFYLLHFPPVTVIEITLQAALQLSILICFLIFS